MKITVPWPMSKFFVFIDFLPWQHLRKNSHEYALEEDTEHMFR